MVFESPKFIPFKSLNTKTFSLHVFVPSVHSRPDTRKTSEILLGKRAEKVEDFRQT